MPRNMSFALTTPQVKAEIKDVTRRTGWDDAKPGDVYWAVEKGMELKKGEKINRLKLIEVVSVRKEPLNAITQDDVRREGFPDWTPEQFIAFFIKQKKGLTATTSVNRIEYRYLGSGINIETMGTVSEDALYASYTDGHVPLAEFAYALMLDDYAADCIASEAEMVDAKYGHAFILDHCQHAWHRPLTGTEKAKYDYDPDKEVWDWCCADEAGAEAITAFAYEP